jgi:hypothetical protein
MSANVFWVRVDKGHHEIPTMAPSSFIEKLKRAGLFRQRLTVSDSQRLLSFLSALDDAEVIEVLEGILNRLYDDQEIKIDAEY